MNAVYGYAVVFLGAGIGGALRHAINLLTLPSGRAFPLGTMAVNVLGGLAMGAVAGWFMPDSAVSHIRPYFAGEAGQRVRLFLTTGVLGGFTTFSAFSLDAALMIERGKWGVALLYAVASVTLSVAGLFLGLALTRQ